VQVDVSPTRPTARRSKVVLFEPGAGGHRPVYLRRFAEALAPVADVLLATSDETADAIDGAVDAEIVRLGKGLEGFPLRQVKRWWTFLADEHRRFREIAHGADHVVHLFADHLLPVLASGPRVPAPTSLLLFYPKAHYPSLYDSPLSVSQRAAARGNELLLARWRRRADAHAVWTLDEGAAEAWQRQGAAPAHWLTEPPTAASLDGVDLRPRDGCVLYGAHAYRKGLDRLANALTLEPTTVRVTVAGYVYPSYRSDFERSIDALERAGLRVDLRTHPHSELEGLRALAEARCAVLPYRDHVGMSRVLLEAAVAGTPVVVHRSGLLGHLVERHGIGLAVDADDPSALRRAVLGLCDDRSETDRYAATLATFAARYSKSEFTSALRGPLGL
jgi:glycosyltransferase involved in cell wall biosynthesis